MAEKVYGCEHCGEIITNESIVVIISISHPSIEHLNGEIQRILFCNLDCLTNYFNSESKYNIQSKGEINNGITESKKTS